jgi:hypothetical protein
MDKIYVKFSLHSGETVHFNDAFLPGATLLFRCAHIGLYQFRGSHTMTCEQSVWAGIAPKCTRLPLTVHGEMRVIIRQQALICQANTTAIWRR